MIAHGIVRGVVRHVVFFRVYVLVGEDGLAVGFGIAVGAEVKLVIGSVVEVIVQRDGFVFGGVEHRINGRERRGMIGVARKADEDDQVVVTAMVRLAVLGAFDGLDVLFALLATLLIGFLGNLHIRLQPHRSRVDSIDAIGRGDHFTFTVVLGIAVKAVFVFHEGETFGVVHVVVELIARGKAFDDLTIGLGEANRCFLEERQKPIGKRPKKVLIVWLVFS